MGKNLVDLFKMVDKFGITDESKHLLISVAPNLMTIESPTIFQWRLTPEQNDDVKFADINAGLLKQDQEKKMTILKKYQYIYQQAP